MLKEELEKFHCYGNDDVFNYSFCKDDKCKWLIACKVHCGHKVAGFQTSVIDQAHAHLTSGETMEVIMINFEISYNAAKMAVKRWRKKHDM